MEIFEENQNFVIYFQKDDISLRLEMPMESFSLEKAQQLIDQEIQRIKENRSKDIENNIISQEIPSFLTILGWIRDYRNELLRESDWSQMQDAPLSEEQKRQWKEYRKELRDLPKKWSFPGSENITEADRVRLGVDISSIHSKSDVTKLPFPPKPL